jgi:hypothetical protein
MARDATTLSGLLLTGLLTGLLTLSGAALIEVNPVIEEGSPVGKAPSRTCTTFRVGLLYAADTELIASGSDLSADSEILYDDGATPEIRKAILCSGPLEAAGAEREHQ